MTVLRNYQRQGVDLLKSFGGRALLADEPGVGKTVQALTYLVEEGIKDTVVVCPASVKYVWRSQALQHCNIPSRVLSGTKPEGAKRGRLTVANYDILADRLDELIGAEMVVLDEAHMIAGRATRRSRAAKLLCKGVPRVLALTGTPVLNRPKDLWPILNILRPDRFHNWPAFGRRFCGPRHRPWGITYDGATNQKELAELLNDLVMIRRRKEDVLSELPERQTEVVPLELSDRKQYDQAQRNFLDWLKGNRPERVRGASRAQGVAKVNYLLQLAAKLKLPAVFDWVDGHISGGQKLLLFASHHEIIDAVKGRYGAACVAVDGRVVGKKRERLFERFNKDPKCRLFVGNIRAAGQGWSCTSTGSVAFCELDWVPGVMEQASDRPRGIGRGGDHPAMVSYLLGLDTVEAQLARVLDRKQKVITSLVDGGDPESAETYSLLCEALLS